MDTNQYGFLRLWMMVLFVSIAFGTTACGDDNADSDDSGDSSQPQGQLAYVSFEGITEDVYTINANGRGKQKRTDAPQNDSFPVWSPDGNQIAFISERDGNAEIYVMNADGNNLRRLTTHVAYDGSPVWSPDGQSIAFISSRLDAHAIFVMQADGSNQQALTDGSISSNDPQWSPDSSQLIFSAGRFGYEQIYRINADGSALTLLTEDDEGKTGQDAIDHQAVWSPDGEWIVFRSDRDGTPEIYVMNKDGNNLRRLTTIGNCDEPQWSPDGSKIVFASNQPNVNQDYISQLYVMNADGSNLNPLTQGNHDNRHATWSPDGQWIAFYTERDPTGIYVISVNGGEATLVARYVARGSKFAWHP